jgi:hypothetical protein
MRRRICLAVGLVALAVPASGWAQSSSQAQYQGVAPETQVPITGGGGPAGGGGAAVTGTGGGTTATGGGRPTSGRPTKATAGKGGNSTSPTSTANRGGTKAPVVSLPSASSSTSPFGGSDIVLIVLAVIGLVALGLVLRRGTRHTPSGA